MILVNETSLNKATVKYRKCVNGEKPLILFWLTDFCVTTTNIENLFIMSLFSHSFFLSLVSCKKPDGWKIINNSKYKDSKNLYNLSLWIVNRHHLYCRQLLQIQNPFHHQPHQSRQWDSLNHFRFSRATLRRCRSLIKYMGELIFLSLFIWIGLLCLPWSCYKISILIQKKYIIEIL